MALDCAKPAEKSNRNGYTEGDGQSGKAEVIRSLCEAADSSPTKVDTSRSKPSPGPQGLSPTASTADPLSSTSSRVDIPSSEPPSKPEGRTISDFKNFYEFLGVKPDASESEIKSAFKKLAMELHPDKHTNDKDHWEERFKELQRVNDTLSNPRSRGIYDAAHMKGQRSGRILVLIDMNGSLLFKARMNEVRGRGIPYPEFQDRYHDFFIRPGAREFLNVILSSDSRIALAVYTSRQPRNAIPQLEQFGKAVGRPRLRNELFALYAGDEFCVPDYDGPRHPDGKYKDKRSLRHIWGDRKTCGQAQIRFDECNTVNIDNDARKLQDHMENALVLPTFDEKSLRSDDRVLHELAIYLQFMSQENFGDVRDFMCNFPFHATGSGIRSRMIPDYVDLLCDGFAEDLQIS